MNIALVGKFYVESFGLHIEEAFLDMGYNCIRIDPEINPLQNYLWGSKLSKINKTLYQEIFSKIPSVRRRKSKSIYNQLKRAKVDFTLVLHDFLTAEEVSEIKKITNSKVILWFPDAISNFQKSLFFTAGYDLLFLVINILYKN